MITVAKDRVDLAQQAAELFVQLASERANRFTVALAGGSTPKALYELLASEEFSSRVDWGKVWVYWGDERWVPASDADSNEGMARAALLDHVPIPPNQILPMYNGESAEEGARSYAAKLVSHLDLVFLGIGEDGHTASVFPGDMATLHSSDPVLPTVSPKATAQRVTLTPATLCRAHSVVFLVAGASKASILKSVLSTDDPDKFPAAYVASHADDVLWLVDQAAASQLDPGANVP